MKTKSLTGALALVSCFMAIPAFAVSLNSKGMGQALIYPYYTVNKNQDTLISISNASDAGQVLWVSILEGYAGRPTLQFWLFLSAHDVWTASISQTADDGGGILKTSDNSCTYPSIPAAGVLLRSAYYDGTGPVPADSGPQGITRTREGFIEFIAGGNLIPGGPTDRAITHQQNGTPGQGAPPGCATLTSISFSEDATVPSNSLFGSAAIVNVGEGTYFAYNADAIAGFTDIPIASYSSGTFVTLIDANSADSSFASGARAYLSDNSGRPLVLDYEFGIDAVSAIFMSDALYNEYLVDASLGSNTDWVVTFPTKEYYTDLLYGHDHFAAPPFEHPFLNARADVAVAADIYDREEGSTPLAGDPQLPYQVNVISFLNTSPAGGVSSGVFGSSLTSVNIPPYASSGAVTLDLSNGEAGIHQLPGGVDGQGRAVSLIGLPATGFMSYNIINTQAQPGMLANYGGAFHHRATTSCSGNVDACDATDSMHGP